VHSASTAPRRSRHLRSGGDDDAIAIGDPRRGRVKAETTAPGRFYVTCPRCSPKRKNKKARVLGVTLDDSGVMWGCSHCDWKGGQFFSQPDSPSPKTNGAHNGASAKPRRKVCEYVYRTAAGEPYLRVDRYEPKESGFPQYRWTGTGWTKGKPAGPKIPYRLPELLAAVHGSCFVVEGEKDADTLTERGFVATTASEGARKWTSDLNTWFEGRTVYIVADADEPGRDHSQLVAKNLSGVAAEVRVLELPAKDVTAWIDAGGDTRELVDIARAAPVWSPEAEAAPNPDEAREQSKEHEAANGEHRETDANPLVFTCLQDVQPQPVEWVWPRRVARGKLTLIAGDPGLGKSQIVNEVVARISKAEPWPDGSLAPEGRCLMLSAEDALADTIRPRVEAAGGDLSKVEVLTAVKGEDGKRRTFSLQSDLAALEQKIAATGDVVLVSIDPITSYMRSIDSHRTTDVRAVLEPLSEFAERTGVAVVAVSHPPKAAQAKAIHAVTGSLAFVAAARFVLLAVEEPETERRLLLPVKNNLSAPADGLGYWLVQRPVTNGVIASYVAWDREPVTTTAGEAIRASHSGGASKMAEAEELLRDALAAGPVPVDTILAKAKENGIGERTMRAAKKKLGAGAVKDGYQGPWAWRLPE
jgi:putative DNA primase/helicase